MKTELIDLMNNLTEIHSDFIKVMDKFVSMLNEAQDEQKREKIRKRWGA